MQGEVAAVLDCVSSCPRMAASSQCWFEESMKSDRCFFLLSVMLKDSCLSIVIMDPNIIFLWSDEQVGWEKVQLRVYPRPFCLKSMCIFSSLLLTSDLAADDVCPTIVLYISFQKHLAECAAWVCLFILFLGGPVKLSSDSTGQLDILCVSSLACWEMDVQLGVSYGSINVYSSFLKKL